MQAERGETDVDQLSVKRSMTTDVLFGGQVLRASALMTIVAHSFPIEKKGMFLLRMGFEC